MTTSTVVFTAKKSNEEAGKELATKALNALNGQLPSVFILFASSTYNLLSTAPVYKSELYT